LAPKQRLVLKWRELESSTDADRTVVLLALSTKSASRPTKLSIVA
jgi:hypothetical protein